MKEFINSIKYNDKRFAILTSVVLCFLIYCIFFGQAFFSDILTFQKYGDDLKMCFPDLIKLGTYHSFMGVDTGTVNGASEIFFTPNLPNMYLPAILASIAMKLIPSRFAYILFFVIHTYIMLYYAQRTASKFFSLNRYLSFLVSCSFLPVLLCETWYISFFIITSLAFVLLYYGLNALENTRKRLWILYALPYVLGFTSGYITVALFLVVFNTVTVLIYGYNYKKELSKRELILRTLIPPFIAGLVNLLYYIQVLLYVKHVVGSGSPTLFDALYYKLGISNLPLILSSAFTSVSPIEQISLLSIGFIWATVMIIFLKKAVTELMVKKERNIFLYSLIINVVFVIIALGVATPFALWFYSLFPVIGAMHIPMRNMPVTLPLLYLAFCIGVKYLTEEKGKKIYWYLCLGFIIFSFLISLYSAHYKIVFFDSQNMLIQLLLASTVFYSIFRKGFTSRVTIILWCVSIVLPGITLFYTMNDIGAQKGVITERSIVYNLDFQKRLDGFISTLPKRNIYKFVAYDTKDVPEFLPGNYAWYSYSKYNLSNYTGYPMYNSAPENYRERFPWFDRIDWDYVINTRADFVVLDNKIVEKNLQFFNTIIDWDDSNKFINNTNRMLKIKKFVPSHYTNKKYLLDNPDVMDNGYFYSHDLKDSDLTNFKTDNATYFSANVDASIPTDVEFLLYPNRYYKYYLDGKEIRPVIDNLQVFISLQNGRHSISIEYRNPIASISNKIYLIFYGFILLSLVIFYFERKFKPKSLIIK